MSNEAEQIKNLLLRRKADLCSGGLLDLLLIGSVATGERCNRVGHSDIDILAIYDDTVAAIDSAQRTAALRTLIALDPHVHVGIRWRKVSELDAFFRHLSLFGFHRGNVLPLLCSGHFELKAVDNRAPAADEALCVLAECLWSEIRLRELVPRSVGERLYIDSKLALAYLNLLLVQQRIFLPLHAVRVQRWEALNLTGGIDLDAVLAGKFGSAPNTAASACAAAVGVLRKQVYHAATALEGCASQDSPPQFWYDGLGSTEDRVRLAKAVVSALYERLTNKNSMPEAPSVAVSWFAEFAKQFLGNGRHLVAGLHKLRVRHSSASSRDWGHILVQ